MDGGVVCCNGTRVGGEDEDPAADGKAPSLGRGWVVLCDGGTCCGGVADEPGDGGPAKPGAGGCEADGTEEKSVTGGLFADAPADAEPAGAARRTTVAPSWIMHLRGSASRWPQ